ncbi:GNAT family N-acetyltransferase [Paenibacillus xylanexedens]|uniref:Ribosomal protein S18 acetylase RimI-like enzyme n=1 Tax=Paenibacillus xylanexedens TaxID=528191 RepID=A0ABS4S1N0_PAEXY|nr:GNAT family N-acetyltransferase [Paenibacillus xylanexedens]MBP2249038.1 ribosomal protein S18 acetylase RimI-like enzyme [Paenibacillus xylanexedens]
MTVETQYSIKKADQTKYSKCFATYRKNIWFRPSWSFLQQMMLDASDCFWIYRDDKRVAGISLSNNELGSFFMIPPFALTVDIVSFLKDVVVKSSEGSHRVEAYNVLSEHIEVFMNEGFNILSTRKCMIRPTEKIETSLPSDITCVKPNLEHITSITQLMNEAYCTGPDKRDLDTYRRDLIYYFEHNNQEEVLDASTILVQKETNEIVGVCLVSIWEGIPLIYEIAVKPNYNNQGLGRYMLCKAITHLESVYPVIRLFLTAGNNAEYLYSKLGFLSGEETSHLVFETEETPIATQ